MLTAGPHMRPRTRGAQLRSRGIAAALPWWGCLLLGAIACAGEPPPRAATPTSNEIRVRSGGLGLELVRAEYQPELVLLRVEVRNDGPEPVTIDPNAVFLAFDDLEYPTHTGPERPRARPLTVPVGATAPLDLSFRLARALSRDGELVFRDVRRGPDGEAAFLDPMSLFVPAQPAVGPAAADDQAGSGP